MTILLQKVNFPGGHKTPVKRTFDSIYFKLNPGRAQVILTR